MSLDFLEILATYGISGVVVIVGALLLYKYLTTLIEKWVYRNQNKTSQFDIGKDVNLRFHSFFSNAQYRLMVEIPNMEFNPLQPTRQKLFRDLLYCRIKALHDSSLSFAEMDMTSMSKNEWSRISLKALLEMVKEFESLAREKGIPDIVIEKFNRWHESTLLIVKEYITMIGSSEIYTTNIARMNTLLMVMNLELITTIGDAERSLKELNGELSGLTYGNSTLE